MTKAAPKRTAGKRQARKKKAAVTEATTSDSGRAKRQQQKKRHPPDPCVSFVEACRQRFDFLVAEHGFAPPIATSYARECSVLYRRDDRSLYLHGDIGYQPSVILALVNTTLSMGFHEIVSACDGPRWNRRPSTDPSLFSTDQLGAWLDFYRDYFVDHLNTFLGGTIATPLGDHLEGLPDGLRAIVQAVLAQRTAAH